MAIYDWRSVLAEAYGSTIAIVANGPSIVANQVKGSSFVGVPDSFKEDVIVHTTDFSTFPHPLWCVNGGHFYHPDKCTLSWNMDDFKDPCMLEHPTVDWYYSLFEGDTGIPIFSSYEYPEWPRVIAFPLEEALMATKMMYFTETIQYMFAFAYMAKLKEIHCYGTDYMTHDRQPGQRANSEWWLGFLHHAGIKVKISPYSNLMKAPEIEPFVTGSYGYTNEKGLGCDLEDIDKRITAGETWEFDPEGWKPSQEG